MDLYMLHTVYFTPILRYSFDVHAIVPYEQNSVLRSIAREVPLSDITRAHIQNLIADMKRLLLKEKFGVAMAASQVGEPLRLFVVSGRALSERTEEGKKKKPEEPTPGGSAWSEDQVYINPVVVKMSRKKIDKHEGCLSIRGKWGEVPRAEKVTLNAYDEHGKKITRGASGFLAHIFQHEMDHLEGILYIDKATNIYDDEPEQ